MQITNKMTWRRDSNGLPLVYRQGRSRGLHARVLAVLLVGLGLFAHALSQAAVEAAVPAWRAVGGHEAYRNNNLEDHFGNEHRMILSFLKSRRKTENGVNHAADQQGAASAAGGCNSATTQAPTMQVESRNSNEDQHPGDSEVSAGNAEKRPSDKKPPKSKSKVILDLCGGTGAWSKPYKDAGYDVRVITLPDHDVFTYEPPESVYGILAAPTCTQFSLARTTGKTPRDLRGGMALVKRCLEIIWEARCKGTLKFWALENPMGYLRQFLGRPPLTFQPCDYGDPHTKRTDVSGLLQYADKKASETHGQPGEALRQQQPRASRHPRGLQDAARP